MAPDYGLTPAELDAIEAQYGGVMPSFYDRQAWEEQQQQQTRRPNGIKGTITKAKRATIYTRDGYKCVTCGEDDLALLTIDHKVPKSKGGHNGHSNLQTMCVDCNRRKADALPLSGR